MTWRVATSGYAEVWLQWSGLRYTSSVWPWPGAPKVRICTVQRFGLHQYQSNLTRDGQADTQQSTPLDNTLKGICPQDHLYVWIHNTVADATMFNNPKVYSTIQNNHACMRSPWKRRQARDGRCTQKFGHAAKASTIRPCWYKHDSIESSICKSQQGGGNKFQIYLLTVKEMVVTYHAHAYSKHLFKCNAILDNSYNKLLKTKMQ
jgi:hypothetical protein